MATLCIASTPTSMCFITPDQTRYAHPSLRNCFACEKHRHSEMRRHEMRCQMCEICNFEGFCEYTKDNQIVCQKCCIDEKKFKACDISNDNLPVVAEIQNLLDRLLSGKVAVVVKVIGMANDIGGKVVGGYANMLMVAFIDNVLVKCIVVDIHDDTFEGFGNKEMIGARNTLQLAYYDTIRLEISPQDQVFLNNAVLGAVLIGLSIHFFIKSIHFWMCSPEENNDYLLFGSFWQRRGSHFPSDRDEAQEKLVKFYESFFDFLLEKFPGFDLEKTSQWALIQSITDGEAIKKSKMYPSKNLPMHFGDALSKLADGFGPRKLNVHNHQFLPPTLVEQPEFQKTLEEETFVICIKNVTPRSLVPRPRVPTRCPLSIPSLDKDGIIGQSIANGVDFSSIQSAKEASNLLLRYLFTGIYQ